MYNFELQWRIAAIAAVAPWLLHISALKLMFMRFLQLSSGLCKMQQLSKDTLLVVSTCKYFLFCMDGALSWEHTYLTQFIK